MRLAAIMENTTTKAQRDARNAERIQRAQRAAKMGISPATIAKLFELSATDLERVTARARSN